VIFQATLREILQKNPAITERSTPPRGWPDYRIEFRVHCETDACPPDAAVAISVNMVREYRVSDKLPDYLFARREDRRAAALDKSSHSGRMPHAGSVLAHQGSRVRFSVDAKSTTPLPMEAS
jgi:hypothetical protein